MEKDSIQNIKAKLVSLKENIGSIVLIVGFVAILQNAGAFEKKSIILWCVLGVILVMWAGNLIAIKMIDRARATKNTNTKAVILNDTTISEKDDEYIYDEYSYRDSINDELTE